MTISQRYARLNREQGERRKLLEREGIEESRIEEILKVYSDEFLSELRYERRKCDESIENLEIVCSVRVRNNLDDDIHLTSDGFGWMDEIEDEKISEGLAKLSGRERKVVSSYVFDGYGSIRETAEHLNLTDKQVRDSLRKVRGKIDISHLRS